MSRVRALALVVAATLALSVAQPKPAEAGDAGGIVAGLAIGALAVGLLQSHYGAYPYGYGYPYYGYAYAPPYPYFPPYPGYYYQPYPGHYYYGYWRPW